jgi:hypothetical protein
MSPPSASAARSAASNRSGNPLELELHAAIIAGQTVGRSIMLAWALTPSVAA